nr:hypothetical protein [Tanacetum cinerariifolium]
MTEPTMEEYMTRTREGYGSGIARPKIKEKDHFEQKGQFLKELHNNTFSGSNNKDVNEHIKKVLKIVDSFHIPNITQDQVVLRAFPMSLTGVASRWLRNEITIQLQLGKLLKNFFSKYCPPAQTAKKMEEISNFQQDPNETIYQARYVISGLQNSKLFFVPRKATVPIPSRLYDDCYDEEDGSSGLQDLDAYLIGTTLLDDALPLKEKDPGSFTLPCYINHLCFNKALADLGASVSVIPFSTYINLENILVGIDKFVFTVDFIMIDIPEDIKTPLILGRPFLSIAHAKIDVFKRKITLKVRNTNDFIVMENMDSYRDEGMDFIVMENMDSYRDEGMGNIIVRRLFFRKACVKTRRFDGMITIYKGNDSVTYQMARSHPRFKHLTNVQCNKMRPLLKVSAHDELKGSEIHLMTWMTRRLPRHWRLANQRPPRSGGVDMSDCRYDVNMRLQVAAGQSGKDMWRGGWRLMIGSNTSSGNSAVEFFCTNSGKMHWQWELSSRNAFALTVVKCTSSGIFITSSGNDLEYLFPT